LASGSVISMEGCDDEAVLLGRKTLLLFESTDQSRSAVVRDLDAQVFMDLLLLESSSMESQNSIVRLDNFLICRPSPPIESSLSSS
jgi:hypothetical protein